VAGTIAEEKFAKRRVPGWRSFVTQPVLSEAEVVASGDNGYICYSGGKCYFALTTLFGWQSEVFC